MKTEASNRKPAGLAIGLLLLTSLTGCLQDALDSVDGIQFSGFPTSATATPGLPATLSGVIEASDGLDSIHVETFAPGGALTERSKLDPSGKTKYEIQDLKFSVVAGSCNGPYRIDIKAYSGSDSKSKSIDIQVANATDCQVKPDPDPDILTIKTGLAMGAQDNAGLGSSIDLDAPEVMLAGRAGQNAAAIDLIYLYSFGADSDVLGSPAWAKDNVDFMAGWSAYNSTRFHKIPAGTAFANIKTASQLSALWNQASASTTSIIVKPGDLVITLTNQGRYALIEIVSQVKGEAGEIRMKVAK